MKKIISFLAAYFFLLNTHAQSVGINTEFPSPSAALDISSDHQGILIPKLYLFSANDSTTIMNPANSLLIYNTNEWMPGGKGYYYNSGTASTPEWTSLKPVKFTLPFKDTITTTQDAFTITNFGSGNAINIIGKVQFSDTHETRGKFLMTAWTGAASWVGGISFCVNNLGSNNVSVPPNTDTKVPFYTEAYDLSNNFIRADALLLPSVFIVPVYGIYHFDANVMWSGFSGSTTNVYGGLSIFINDVINLSNRQHAGSMPFSNSLSTDIALNAGDKVCLMVYQNSSTVQYLLNDGLSNRFTGRYVSTY